MGNKQAKAATAATAAQAATRFKASVRGGSASAEQSPPAPPPTTEKPEKPEEPEEPETVPTTKEPIPVTDTPEAAVDEQPEEEQEGGPEEEVKEAAEKLSVVMPSLNLDNIDRNPPHEEQEDDPDLMAPPVFLTDAMSKLEDTDQQTKPKQRSSNEAVLIASPITHDGVSLDAPAPARAPIEVPPDRDDVSIDEHVSAVDEDAPLEPKGSASEDIVLSAFDRVPGYIPEDTASLTSSVARGEDELLKNIMGASLALPALTSNESVRGSVAVSEYYVDESHWESARRMESAEKPLELMPRLVSVMIQSSGHEVEVIFEYKGSKDIPVEDPKPQEAVEGEEVTPEPVAPVTSDVDASLGDPIVKNVVSSIFSNVVHQSISEESRETAEHEAMKSVAVDFAEVDGTLKVHMIPLDDHTHRVESYPSEVSSKQWSVDLNTPFVNSFVGDEAIQSLDESLELSTKETDDAMGAPVAKATEEPPLSTDTSTPMVTETTEPTEAVAEAVIVPSAEEVEPPITESDPKELLDADVTAASTLSQQQDAPVDVETEIQDTVKTGDTEEPPLGSVSVDEKPQSVVGATEAVVDVVDVTSASVIEPTVKESDPKDASIDTKTDEGDFKDPPTETAVTDAIPAAPVTSTEAIAVEPPIDDAKPTETDSKAPVQDPVAPLESVPSGEAKKPRKSKSRKKKNKQTSSGTRTSSSGLLVVDGLNPRGMVVDGLTSVGSSKKSSTLKD